jgi:hypothetical protein
MLYRWLLLLTLLVATSAFAQQPSCEIELPVGVVGIDFSLLHGLTPQDVTVRVNKQQKKVESINYDTEPRRVLFILDTASSLAPDARKAEAKLVQYIASSARKGDTFALLTARGALREVKFAEGPESLLKAANELLADPKEKNKAAGILDALVQGISWFGEPRAGDAIVVVANHLEEPRQRTSGLIVEHSKLVAVDQEGDTGPVSRAKFRTVQQALFEHGIRLFGLQLGRVVVGVTDSITDENLFGLAYGSGGYAIPVEADDPWNTYQLTDARWQKLQHKVWQLYGAVAQFYRLRVQSPVSAHRQEWKIELAKDLEKNTRILYPREYGMCSSDLAKAPR